MAPVTRPTSIRLQDIQLEGKVTKFQQFILDYFREQGLEEKFEDYLDEIEVYLVLRRFVQHITCSRF